MTRVFVVEWWELWLSGIMVQSGWPQHGRRPAGAFGDRASVDTFVDRMQLNREFVRVRHVRRYRVKR